MGLFSSIGKVLGGGLSALSGGAGGLFGEISGNNASANSYLKYQKEAMNRQNALYDDGRTGFTTALGGALNENQPYAMAGQNALMQQQGLLGIGGNPEAAQNAFNNYQNSTGYQFRLNQGTNALQNSAAAKGSLFSGATGKALQDFGQNLASQEFGNYYGALNGLSNQGQQAGAQNAQLRYNYGNALLNSYQNQGVQNSQAILGIADTKNARDSGNSGGVGDLLGNAGSLISLGSAIFSDIRLKTDIEHIGYAESGLPVYEYNYVWGGERQRGMMAHEVEAVFPDAVSTHESGFQMVDYSKVN